MNKNKLNLNDISKRKKEENNLNYNHYPRFSFFPNLINSIQLLCDCGYQQIISLEDYLTIINDTMVDITDKHIKLSLNYFKFRYKPPLSKEDNETSKKNKDKKILLSLLLQNKPISKLREDIIEARNHLNHYLTYVKDRQINELTMLINNTQKSYENAQNRNKNIIKLIELLLHNYSSSNFIDRDYAIVNFISSFDFSFKHFQFENELLSQESITNLLNYFDTYSIIKPCDKVITNKFSYQRTLYKHKYDITFLFLLNDGRLASCSYDKVIRICQIQEHQFIKNEIILQGHKEEVTNVCQLDTGHLVSCSIDGTIKIWTPYQNTFIEHFSINEAHDDYINKVITLSNNRIGSCSDDSTIKIWQSLEPFNLIITLKGHKKIVNSILQLRGKEILLSVSDDWTVRKWNLHSYQCETIIMNHDDYINCICICYTNIIELENGFILLSGNNSISIIRNDTLITETRGIGERLNTRNPIILRNGKILVGCKSGMLIFYDLIRRNITIQDISNKNITATYALRIDNKSFYTGGADGQIMKWNY